MADDNMVISFDPDDLTIGEICDFEDICGMPIGAFNPQNMNARMLLAMVYINGKRSNPGYTLEDAKGVKITAINTSAFNGNPTPAVPLEPLRPAKGKRAHA